MIKLLTAENVEHAHLVLNQPSVIRNSTLCAHASSRQYNKLGTTKTMERNQSVIDIIV